MKTASLQRESIYKSPEGEQVIMDLYNQGMAMWPVPYQQINLITTPCPTFVAAWGDESAPPLVLLHGSGGNAVTWMPDAVTYGKHFRVYAIDIPGEPGKSAQVRPAWSGPFYTEWLEKVFEELGLESAILGGISLGGWTAIKYAIAHPQRVEKLCLVCPGGIHAPRRSFLIRTIFYYSTSGTKGREKMLNYMFNNRPVPGELAQYMQLMSDNYNFRRENLPLFSDAQLRNLRMPVYFLAGEQDVIFHSRKAGNRLRRVLPHAVVEVLPEEGHMLLGTGERIVKFINRNHQQE